MKNTIRKISALLLAAAMMLPAFACGSNSSNDESSNTADLSSDESSADSSAGDAESGLDIQIDDPNAVVDGTSANADNTPSGQVTTDPNVVTDAGGGQNNKLVFLEPTKEQEEAANGNRPIITTKRGSDGTYYIPQTDINGAIVTDTNGESKTEVFTGTTVAAKYEEPTYEPNQKTYQAYWLDISERKDFVFEGNLLEFEVKISEDAKDGVYPVEMFFTDFSNYDAKSLKDIACRPGYICINSDQPAEIPLNDGQMTLTPDTLSAKPGDVIKMNVRIDNNPGIVAFVVRMHYDANIMTITNAGAGSDLGELAPLTASPMA
ncbi:MAG: hypothetical protein MJ071_08845 [Oscillospiraceae bacterium]|nr:hypothetical protein [Oscillospiraceae bacterium]